MEGIEMREIANNPQYTPPNSSDESTSLENQPSSQTDPSSSGTVEQDYVLKQCIEMQKRQDLVKKLKATFLEGGTFCSILVEIMKWGDVLSENSTSQDRDHSNFYKSFRSFWSIHLENIIFLFVIISISFSLLDLFLLLFTLWGVLSKPRTTEKFWVILLLFVFLRFCLLLIFFIDYSDSLKILTDLQIVSETNIVELIIQFVGTFAVGCYLYNYWRLRANISKNELHQERCKLAEEMNKIKTCTSSEFIDSSENVSYFISIINHFKALYQIETISFTFFNYTFTLVIDIVICLMLTTSPLYDHMKGLMQPYWQCLPLFLALLHFLSICGQRACYKSRNMKWTVILFCAHVVLLPLFLIIMRFCYQKTVLTNVIYWRIISLALVASYFIKAIQMKNGFPHKTSGYFMGQSYRFRYEALLILFMRIPFLYEFRILLDWIALETQLNWRQFCEVENIFTTLYSVKCEQGKKPPHGKVVQVAVFWVLVGVVWSFPITICFFSKMKIQTEITQAELEIRIENYEPFFRATHEEIRNIDINKMPANIFPCLSSSSSSSSSMTPSTFVHRHDQFDFGQIVFGPESEMFWSISPPARYRLKTHLSNDRKDVHLFLKYQITRRLVAESNEDFFNPISVGVLKWTLNNFTKLDFRAALNGFENSVVFSDIAHKGIQITNDGQVMVVGKTNFKLILTRFGKKESEWWSLGTSGDNTNYPVSELFAVYFASERAVEPLWNQILKLGLIAIWLKVTMIVKNGARSLISDNSVANIMFTELPNVDSILKLTELIYVSRDLQLPEVELKIYQYLCQLFRSPESLVECTKND